MRDFPERLQRSLALLGLRPEGNGRHRGTWVDLSALVLPAGEAPPWRPAEQDDPWLVRVGDGPAQIELLVEGRDVADPEQLAGVLRKAARMARGRRCA